MEVGFLQFQPEFCNVEVNQNKIFSFVEKAKGFDLLVLPELANSGYVFTKRSELEKVAETIPSGYFVEKLIELAKQKDGFIISGVCEKKEAVFFNSSVIVGPEGYIGKYRKIHLFDREKLFFEPGLKTFEVFEIREAKVGMMICFDWIFPESARILALKGAEIIAHPANLVLPYSQTAMLARSIENKVFTITANRIGKEENSGISLTFTGQSQITSPEMEILAQASKNQEEIRFVDIDCKLARNKWINERNNLFDDRRKELYDVL